jgi:hypothetical protein
MCWRNQLEATCRQPGKEERKKKRGKGREGREERKRGDKETQDKRGAKKGMSGI